MLNDLNAIIDFVRSKGFDLNYQKVVFDVGNGVEIITGIVLTKDNRIISNSEPNEKDKD